MPETKKEFIGENKGRPLTLKDLKSLIGISVQKVEEFDRGPFDSGFYIYFSNGAILSAQDGEYGDNAFRLVKGNA